MSNEHDGNVKEAKEKVARIVKESILLGEDYFLTSEENENDEQLKAEIEGKIDKIIDESAIGQLMKEVKQTIEKNMAKIEEIVQAIEDFKQKEIDEKVDKIVKDSIERGEDYFVSPKKKKEFTWPDEEI